MTSQVQSVSSTSTMKELAVVRSKSVPEGEEVAPCKPVSTQSSEDSEEESSEKKPSTEPESEVRKDTYIPVFVKVSVKRVFVQTYWSLNLNIFLDKLLLRDS